MYTNQRQTPDTKELRRVGGRWLKERRESAGLSQRQLADILGVEYYTFISQIETGHGRIPPDRYEAWANAIGLSLADFVREILRYYDPVTFSILFGNASPTEADTASEGVLAAENRQLREQVRELQRLLGKKTMELELARERLSPLPPSIGEASDSGNRTLRKGAGKHRATGADKGDASHGGAQQPLAAEAPCGGARLSTAED
jgi:transcriptional regulator with XRE-family HTH domain